MIVIQLRYKQEFSMFLMLCRLQQNITRHKLSCYALKVQSEGDIYAVLASDSKVILSE